MCYYLIKLDICIENNNIVNVRMLYCMLIVERCNNIFFFFYNFDLPGKIAKILLIFKKYDIFALSKGLKKYYIIKKFIEYFRVVF